MTADELLKIEQQGADFVRALIPFTNTCSSGRGLGNTMWVQAYQWRGHCFIVDRQPPSYWRDQAREGLGWTSDYAFFAGAETAIKEWEDADVDA